MKVNSTRMKIRIVVPIWALWDLLAHQPTHAVISLTSNRLQPHLHTFVCVCDSRSVLIRRGCDGRTLEEQGQSPVKTNIQILPCKRVSQRLGLATNYHRSQCVANCTLETKIKKKIEKKCFLTMGVRGAGRGDPRQARTLLVCGPCPCVWPLANSSNSRAMSTAHGSTTCSKAARKCCEPVDRLAAVSEADQQNYSSPIWIMASQNRTFMSCLLTLDHWRMHLYIMTDPADLWVSLVENLLYLLFSRFVVNFYILYCSNFRNGRCCFRASLWRSQSHETVQRSSAWWQTNEHSTGHLRGALTNDTTQQGSNNGRKRWWSSSTKATW